MNRIQDTKHYRLRSGLPCVNHRCVQCCFRTSMPLSRLDIKRILRLGHSFDSFAAKTEGGWRLKNRSGRCVFLMRDGCRIYQFRPEGCRLYPLVWDQDSERAVLDDLCPYQDEFWVSEQDTRALRSLLGKLKE